MKKKCSKIAFILIVSAFAASVSPAADLVNWNFAGNFANSSGKGCSQPGAVVGGTITGSIIIADTDGITAYPATSPFPGDTETVFGVNGPASLNFTLSYGGSSYDYSGSFYFIMDTSISGSGLDDFWFWGNCNDNLKFLIHLIEPPIDGLPTSPTLSGFLQATTSLPSLGNTRLVSLGDGYFGNSVSGNLTSFGESITPVPEPSVIGLCGVTALAFLFRRLRADKKTLSILPKQEAGHTEDMLRKFELVGE